MPRVQLAAGHRVLRRGPDQVQVGLDPRHAVVLRETEAVRRTLSVLRVHGPDEAADAEVLARLRDRGLVEDTAPAAETGGAVDLREFGAVSLPVRALLEEAGLAMVDPMRESADVGLLVGVGEPDRDLLDAWVVEGLPHLVLRLSEGAALVGPFVVPGRGACLRCIDGHRTDVDPRWPLLVEQQAATAVREDAVADPAPATLVSLGAAWAAADLAAHLAGGRPATWSATLRLPPLLAGTELVTWRRHPACGCGWNAGHPPGVSRERDGHPWEGSGSYPPWVMMEE